MIKQHLKCFICSESGAVTVDWVVLAAATVGLGISTAAVVRTGTSNMGTEIGNSLSSASVAAVQAAADSFSTYEWWAPGDVEDGVHSLQNWVEDFATMGETRFMEVYAEFSGYVMGGSDGEYMDLLYLWETERRVQGWDVPDGVADFETAHSYYQSNT